MKRGRLASAVVTMISIPALGLILNGSATARVTSARSFSEDAVFSENMVAINCQGQPQVRPRSFTLACADGNDYLSGLRWTSWAPGLASATGLQTVNDCVPYCAAGHFHRYPVDAVFWGSAAAGPGSQRYTKITLLYPGARPAYAGASGSVTLDTP
jgi:hypothetical protein